MKIRHTGNPERQVGMRDAHGNPVPLQHVAVRGSIEGLLARVEIDQTFVNREPIPIEAVYTFPLPAGAVLFRLEVEIAGRMLQGVIVPRAKAEERYEDAIADGDAPIRLQALGEHLYCLQLGNLVAGERCTVKFCFGELLRPAGDSARWVLPTAIGHRYGAPAMAPHQAPETDLAAEHRYELDLRVCGPWNKESLHSPSHAIFVDVVDGGDARIRLREPSAAMDRDFVLALSWTGQAIATATSVRDGDEWTTHVAWRPEIRIPDRDEPCAFKILIDCSGSMAGTSIRQARTALARIVGELRDDDRFNIYRFGSDTRAVLPGMQRAGEVRRIVLALLADMEADMGGTEMQKALVASFRDEPPLLADVLLVTDGEVHDVTRIIEAARQSGCRVFTVGVGAAPNSALIGGLAKATGGAAEFVTPSEEMAERIVRHFRRMRETRVTGVRIDWGGEARTQAPSAFRAVYRGDTVHAFGWTRQRPDTVAVSATRADGQTIVDRIAVDTTRAYAELPRLGAASLVADSVADAEALALKYQLVSQWTDCMVVHARTEAEKPRELPELRKIAQMHVAGQAGVGMMSLHAIDLPTMHARLPSVLHDRDESGDYFDSFCGLDTPALHRRESFPDSLLACTRWRGDTGLSVKTLEALEDAGAPVDILDVLRSLVGEGFAEYTVVVAYLCRVVEEGKSRTRHLDACRGIARAWKHVLDEDPRARETADRVASAVPSIQVVS